MPDRIRHLSAAVFMTAALASACGESTGAGAAEGDAGPPGSGQPNDTANAYYAGPASAALGSPTNEADCALCHSLDDRPGFAGSPLRDIAYRDSFKGGAAPYLLYAVNSCVTGWMGGRSLLTTSAEWQSLESYLQSISDPAQTTPNSLEPELLANEAAYEAAYGGGDATEGASLYALYCGTCHEAGLVLDRSPAPPLEELKPLSVGRIAQQVRTAGPQPSGSADERDTTPGPMPFFEPADLSTADLKSIIAYIKSAP